ncbi:carbonic anhydrase family protein [Rasiella sp. SM2506]|uniref:carbonic anhydrase family protein n=1 Tax=Rasiella sp. SM2506 TaxID=3423914 RepID=UPI003D7B7329
MKTHTKETQSTLTPSKALLFLKEGNERFQNNLKANRNLLQQVNETSDGQFPFAVILSCIDSRVSAELVFDQGLGDIFSVRIAGNFVNEDILGSIEYGCKVAGSKLVVVLGHTSCGAIKGACDDVKLGNITSLISKIKPAVKDVKEPSNAAERTSANLEFVNEVSKVNVHKTIENMREDSSVLSEMEQNGEIKIVGAMYDVENGEVEFYN